MSRHTTQLQQATAASLYPSGASLPSHVQEIVEQALTYRMEEERRLNEEKNRLVMELFEEKDSELEQQKALIHSLQTERSEAQEAVVRLGHEHSERERQQQTERDRYREECARREAQVEDSQQMLKQVSEHLDETLAWKKEHAKLSTERERRVRELDEQVSALREEKELCLDQLAAVEEARQGEVARRQQWQREAESGVEQLEQCRQRLETETNMRLKLEEGRACDVLEMGTVRTYFAHDLPLLSPY